ncbi:hypothetical protein C8Q74DRAFT_1315371 [Fomes fomentarius]|nr:hypothetical protein C8Q74DRAFT_1315371 [Fomes fomentarius]
MPTATTATAPSVLSLKVPPPTASASAAATLRSLYPRAARAFLQRDVALTHSLLTSAFSLISPPASLATAKDSLSSHRRKWDILRVTFETTLYASPPSTHDPETLPSALRVNLMLTPEPLIATLHGRSLQLFTPSNPPQKATSAFLPGQILVTLVLASLKLDCPEVGRSMIEDWLAKHGQEVDADDPKAYAKVLELYCLHVLPRLQDWEYAEDFLTYESELPHDVRQQFIASLQQLRTEAVTASRIQTALPSGPSSSSSSPSRSASPSPSDSSASSSSTHTATPHTVRPSANGRLHTLTPFTPSQSPTPKPREGTPPHSASSSSIASTATSRTRDRTSKTRRGHANGHANGRAVPPAQSRSRSRASAGAPATNAVIRRSSFGTPATESSARSPSTFALLRASFNSLLQILFVVVPVVARANGPGGGAITNGSTSTGTRAVEAVRKRLKGVDGQSSVVGQLWQEVARAVLDTVSMAGRGLV